MESNITQSTAASVRPNHHMNDEDDVRFVLDGN